jgi:hypothetical protein
MNNDVNAKVAILHNGWEHRKQVQGWTCCDTDGVCL